MEPWAANIRGQRLDRAVDMDFPAGERQDGLFYKLKLEC